MAAMGPQEFENYQARMARELENLRTFVELTGSPPREEDPSSLPPQQRLEIRINVLGDSVKKRIEECWDLDEAVRCRWGATMDGIDVLAPTAANALDGLAERVSTYADGFPYHLGFHNYSAATTLHSALHSLASKLSELATLCIQYKDRDWT